MVAGNPSTSLVSVAESAVNDRTIPTFDGAGRVVDSQDYNGTTLTDSIQTVYGGNQVTSIRPVRAAASSGTPQAAVTDVLGQQTETIQYASAPTVTGSVVTGGSPQATMMSYNAAGNETQIKDPAGNTWSYTYDLLGRQTKAVDPDTGTTVDRLRPGRKRRLHHRRQRDQRQLHLRRAEPQDRRVHRLDHPGQRHPDRDLDLGHPEEGPAVLPRPPSSAASTYDTGILGYDAYGNADRKLWSLVPTGKPLAGTYRTTYDVLLDRTDARRGARRRRRAAGRLDRRSPMTSSATRSPRRATTPTPQARPGRPTTRSPRSTWAPGLRRRR